jgi:hypothetical protein
VEEGIEVAEVTILRAVGIAVDLFQGYRAVGLAASPPQAMMGPSRNFQRTFYMMTILGQTVSKV